MPRFGQMQMAAHLPYRDPAGSFERLGGFFPRNVGERSHYTATTI